MNFISKIKSSAKSPMQKINSAINTSNLSTSINKKLHSVGSSLESIENIANRISDTLTSGADDGFLVRESAVPLRAQVSEIMDSRFASNIDGRKYSGQVTPRKKILSQEADESTIQYPPDIGEHYLSFNFMKYERPNRLVEAKTVSEKVIHLPIPMQLNEQHATSWDIDAQGNMGNLINNGEATAAGEGDAGGSSIDTAIGIAYQGMQGFTTGVLNKIPIIKNLGVDSAINMVGQELGAIPNPQLALIFHGPTLRDFSFAWKFHPHSAEESDQIKNIIQEFRKRALPGIAFKQTNSLLSYPDIVEVTLNSGSSKNDYLYPMKKCAVASFNVNYAPNGTPSFFTGTKAPTFIEFSVTLKEIEYFLAEDFGREQATQTITERAALVFDGSGPAGEEVVQ